MQNLIINLHGRTSETNAINCNKVIHIGLKSWNSKTTIQNKNNVKLFLTLIRFRRVVPVCFIKTEMITNTRNHVSFSILVIHSLTCYFIENSRHHKAHIWPRQIQSDGQGNQTKLVLFSSFPYNFAVIFGQ